MNNLDTEIEDEEDCEGSHDDRIDGDDRGGKIVTRDRPRKRAVWQVAILPESWQQ